MANWFHAAVALCALATVSAADHMPIAELKPEHIRKPSIPSATASNSNEKVFVFLQKFPLLGSFFGLEVFHTEVLVCPRSGFSQMDQDTLDSKIATMTDFAEIAESWWSTKTANCVELGYGGAGCSDECCTVPHDTQTMQFALNERRSVITNADTSKKSLYIYGTGDFDGNVAFHNMCDHKCWSNWAGTDYNIITNNCNTFTSTVLHNVYGLSEKKPNLGVSDLVTVSGHCPKDRETMLSQAAPSSIDSIDNNLLCSTLNNKFLERTMTGKVCKKMERLNATIPHCQESAEHIWDYAAKMCPKGRDIFKAFCKIAGNKQMEDKMVGDVCAKVTEFQKKTFNVTMPVEVCTTLAENVWNLATPLCPKEVALSAPAHPGSSDWLGKTVPENMVHSVNGKEVFRTTGQMACEWGGLSAPIYLRASWKGNVKLATPRPSGAKSLDVVWIGWNNIVEDKVDRYLIVKELDASGATIKEQCTTYPDVNPKGYFDPLPLMADRYKLVKASPTFNEYEYQWKLQNGVEMTSTMVSDPKGFPPKAVDVISTLGSRPSSVYNFSYEPPSDTVDSSVFYEYKKYDCATVSNFTTPDVCVNMWLVLQYECSFTEPYNSEVIV